MLRSTRSRWILPFLRRLPGSGFPALALLTAVLGSATAHAVPLGIANPSCPASSAAATTCRSSGPGIRIYSHSDLAGLSATAEIDAGPLEYSLGFSDNVVNVPPVPEPASAALVALGLAALACSRSAAGPSRRSARDADFPKQRCTCFGSGF